MKGCRAKVRQPFLCAWLWKMGRGNGLGEMDHLTWFTGPFSTAPFFPQVLFIPELNGTIKEVLTAKMLCDRGVAVGKFKELG